MSKPIIFKQKFHKWHDEDLWGHYATSDKNTRALKYLYTSFKHNYSKKRYLKKKKYLFKPRRFQKFYRKQFLYQINEREEEFKRKKRNFKAKNFFNMLKLRIFYGRMKTKPFKNLFKKVTKNKNLGSVATPLFLEGRLDTLLYRTNLFSSIFALKNFIRDKNVFVNGLCITESKFLLNIGDIITISPVAYKGIYNHFLERLRSNKILVNYPPYLEANYRIGSFVLIKPPKFKEIAYPFPVAPRTLLHKFTK